MLNLWGLVTFEDIKSKESRMRPGFVEKCTVGPSVLFCKPLDHDLTVAVSILIPFNGDAIIVLSYFSLNLSILLAILALENE